jgi:peptidoglycan/LPS O-acetylase OafA/YrhL
LLGIGGVPVFFALSAFYTVQKSSGGIALERIINRYWRLFPLVFYPTIVGLLHLSFRTPSGSIDWQAVLANIGMCSNLLSDQNRFSFNGATAHMWSTFADMHASSLLIVSQSFPMFRSHHVWVYVAALCLGLQGALLLSDPCILRFNVDGRPRDSAASERFFGRSNDSGAQSEVAGCEHLLNRDQLNMFMLYFYTSTFSRLTPFAIGAWFGRARQARMIMSRWSYRASVVGIVSVIVRVMSSPMHGAKKETVHWLLDAFNLNVLIPCIVMRFLYEFLDSSHKSLLINGMAELTPWIYALHMCFILPVMSIADTEIIKVLLVLAASFCTTLLIQRLETFVSSVKVVLRSCFFGTGGLDMAPYSPQHTTLSPLWLARALAAHAGTLRARPRHTGAC